MSFVFFHVEYCDIHFVYGFCDGNARAAVEYQRLFPYRRIPSRSVFTRIHQTLRDTGSLSSVAVQSERKVVRTINTRENILQLVQRSPRLSTRRMTSRIGLSRMQVWRTLHEENLYPYHDQRVQHLEPGDHAQGMDLCQWIKAHPELLTLQRGVTSTACHSVNITCRGVTSPARHAARSHSFVYISTS